MTTAPTLKRRIFLSLADHLLSLAQTARTQTNRFEALVTGWTLATIHPDDRPALSAAAYARQKRIDRPGSRDETELSDWERAMFDEYLPKPPAKILVGAAGSGREARALARRGYQIMAFDPCAELIAQARRVKTPSVSYLIGSYEDLVQDGSSFSAAVSAEAPYDAVLLGWGSLSHVSRAQVRIELFRTLGRLSYGPILASYLPHSSTAAPSRIQRLGAKLGRIVSGERILVDPQDTTVPWAGYSHRFDMRELEDLAKATGFRFVSLAPGEPYPHGAFVQ